MPVGFSAEDSRKATNVKDFLSISEHLFKDLEVIHESSLVIDLRVYESKE